MEKANLTDRQKKMVLLKSMTKCFTEEFIAETLSPCVTRNIVKHDFKQAKDELRKAIMRFKPTSK